MILAELTWNQARLSRYHATTVERRFARSLPHNSLPPRRPRTSPTLRSWTRTPRSTGPALAAGTTEPAPHRFRPSGHGAFLPSGHLLLTAERQGVTMKAVVKVKAYCGLGTTTP
ncbi:MAG: hypothetical protein HC888_19620 [Candidatus Competibacteraceae bacterium]|nr:hypothetical protein [Candidatus Competibacteraceae bacterium]